MTLKEYLMDYASQDTREKGEAMIAREIQNIPKEKVRQIVREHLEEIEKGNRDFRILVKKEGREYGDQCNPCG